MLMMEKQLLQLLISKLMLVATLTDCLIKEKVHHLNNTSTSSTIYLASSNEENDVKKKTL